MTEPDWEAVADAAYSAYGLTTGGVNFRGEPMPDWSALPERIREAWRTAAIAAAMEAHGELRDIIARARAALDAIPEPDLAWLAKLAALPEPDVVTTSRVIALAVLDARAILAEAEPEDLEGPASAGSAALHDRGRELLETSRELLETSRELLDAGRARRDALEEDSGRSAGGA